MAENDVIRFFKKILLELKTFFISKNVLSFLVFFFLSTAFWFINALGKERETVVSIPIRYSNLPEDIEIIGNNTNSVTFTLKDKGKNLLSYNKKHLTPLFIDLNRDFYDKGEILISSDQIRTKISRYVLSSTLVTNIYPDTILLQYEKLQSRILPIKFTGEIDLANQYVLSEDIRLEPSEITVYFSKETADSLSFVETEYVKKENLKDTTRFNVKLRPIKSVRFATKETKVSVFVEMFTEKQMQLPIVFENSPKDINIKTFPTFVNAKFNVGLSRFNQTDDIQVVFDYNEINKNISKHKLKLVNNSPYISNIQLLPEEVEFVIEEKEDSLFHFLP